MVATPVLNSRPTTRVEDTPIEVDVRSQRDPNRWWARAFGAMFMGGGLAHLVLLSLNSAAYDSFADASYWPYITDSWRSVVVPNVYYLVPMLAVFELAVGASILSRRIRIVGIAGAATFNAALMLFGWGFFIWSVPVLGLLGLFFVREKTAAGPARGGAR